MKYFEHDQKRVELNTCKPGTVVKVGGLAGVYFLPNLVVWKPDAWPILSTQTFPRIADHRQFTDRTFQILFDVQDGEAIAVNSDCPVLPFPEARLILRPQGHPHRAREED